MTRNTYNTSDTQLVDYERIGNYNVSIVFDDYTDKYTAALDNLNARPGERKRIRVFRNRSFEKTMAEYRQMKVEAENAENAGEQ